MSGPGNMMMVMPKPGPALKGILGAVALLGVVQAVLVNMAKDGGFFFLLTCTTDALLHGQVWRLVTSGFLTDPQSLNHLLFSLLGFYFLSPDLERRWGSGRFLRFVLTAIALGNLASLALALVRPEWAGIGGRIGFFGPSAAIAAIAVAWSRENPDAEIRLFFFLPMSGRGLLYVTLGFAALGIIYPMSFSEGIPAPFGGIAAGLLLAGSPSLVRSAYLRLRLATLRRSAAKLGTPSAEEILRRGPSRGNRGSAPSLRMIQGGLEEELRKRPPPKDKRYLN